MKTYYLYILADKKLGKLYIDITDNILKSVIEQRERIIGGKENNDLMLVYYEKAGNVLSAISYKKKLQKWNDIWKNILVEKFNPDWIDLCNDKKFIDEFP